MKLILLLFFFLLFWTFFFAYHDRIGRVAGIEISYLLIFPSVYYQYIIKHNGEKKNKKNNVTVAWNTVESKGLCYCIMSCSYILNSEGIHSVPVILGVISVDHRNSCFQIGSVLSMFERLF